MEPKEAAKIVPRKEGIVKERNGKYEERIGKVMRIVLGR
jgi:hypothetical protein